MTMESTQLAGVIGHPISHSLSPKIFDFLSRQLKTPMVYRRIDVSPQDLKKTMEVFGDLGIFVGLNVTVPHKNSVLKHLHDMSDAAAALGAANVVHFKKGQAYGHNTDVFGITKTLEEQGFRTKGQEAVVFGAGGAARAACYALIKKSCKRVWVWNRNSRRAQAMIRDFKKISNRTEFVFLRDPEKIESQVRLFINATPLGMKGFPKQSPLPGGGELEGLAFDLVYRPLVTPFLRQAEKRGLKTVNGLDMLIWQALATWKIWIKSIPQEADVKSQLKKVLQSSL